MVIVTFTFNRQRIAVFGPDEKIIKDTIKKAYPTATQFVIQEVESVLHSDVLSIALALEVNKKI